ncbi:MAG: hypothetical protein KY464_02625 [Gemmatimonadetes bacterium]|nr:hypothetical protein [Gemmatimonadota bacterium]
MPVVRSSERLLRRAIPGLKGIILVLLFVACRPQSPGSASASAAIPSAARPLFALYRAFLTAPDPHAAMQNVICEGSRLYDAYGDEEGGRLVDSAEQAFLESLSAAEKVEYRTRDASLAGATFEISNVSGDGTILPGVCGQR